MGSYLILNAPSLSEAADHIGEPQLTQTWQPIGADILFTDTALTDAECAALYASYTPSGLNDHEYKPPLPQPVQDAIQTFKQAEAAGFPATMTAAQRSALSQATWVLFRYMNRRFLDE